MVFIHSVIFPQSFKQRRFSRHFYMALAISGALRADAVNEATYWSGEVMGSKQSP